MGYSVKSVRVTTPWFGTKRFYVPMHSSFNSWDASSLPFQNEEEYPTVWGYENEDDAWKAVDKHILETQQFEEEMVSRGLTDREDFHADG